MKRFFSLAIALAVVVTTGVAYAGSRRGNSVNRLVAEVEDSVGNYSKLIDTNAMDLNISAYSDDEVEYDVPEFQEVQRSELPSGDVKEYLMFESDEQMVKYDCDTGLVRAIVTRDAARPATYSSQEPDFSNSEIEEITANLVDYIGLDLDVTDCVLETSNMTLGEEELLNVSVEEITSDGVYTGNSMFYQLTCDGLVSLVAIDYGNREVAEEIPDISKNEAVSMIEDVLRSKYTEDELYDLSFDVELRVLSDKLCWCIIADGIRTEKLEYSYAVTVDAVSGDILAVDYSEALI